MTPTFFRAEITDSNRPAGDEGSVTDCRPAVTIHDHTCAIELISVYTENVQIFDLPARNAGIALQQARLAAYVRQQAWEL